MSLRTKLVVEHNMNILIDDYEHRYSYSNGSVDIKLRFIDFLIDFREDEIDFAISYIKETSKGLYEFLFPIILEYRNFGLSSFRDSEPSEPIKEQKFFDKIKNLFKKQEAADGRSSN